MSHHLLEISSKFFRFFHNLVIQDSLKYSQNSWNFSQNSFEIRSENHKEDYLALNTAFEKRRIVPLPKMHLFWPIRNRFIFKIWRRSRVFGGRTNRRNGNTREFWGLQVHGLHLHTNLPWYFLCTKLRFNVPLLCSQLGLCTQNGWNYSKVGEFFIWRGGGEKNSTKSSSIWEDSGESQKERCWRK